MEHHVLQKLFRFYDFNSQDQHIFFSLNSPMKQKIAFTVIEKRDLFPLRNSSKPFPLVGEIKIYSNAVSQTADDSLYSSIIIDKLVFRPKLALHIV